MFGQIKRVKLETSRTVILPPAVSVLCTISKFTSPKGRARAVHDHVGLRGLAAEEGGEK